MVTSPGYSVKATSASSKSATYTGGSYGGQQSGGQQKSFNKKAYIKKMSTFDPEWKNSRMKQFQMTLKCQEISKQAE